MISCVVLCVVICCADEGTGRISTINTTTAASPQLHSEEAQRSDIGIDVDIGRQWEMADGINAPERTRSRGVAGGIVCVIDGRAEVHAGGWNGRWAVFPLARGSARRKVEWQWSVFENRPRHGHGLGFGLVSAGWGGRRKNRKAGACSKSPSNVGSCGAATSSLAMVELGAKRA